jgi:hypothetical protein
MSPSWAFKRPKSPKISKMSFKMGNVRLYLAIAKKVSGLSFRWHAIKKKNIFSGSHGAPYWALKRQKSFKKSKTSLKLGKVRLYVLITNKI